MNNKVLFILTCKHLVLASVNVNLTECLVCHEQARVKDIQIHEWRSWCLRKGCTFSKWHGISQRSAEMAANAHWRRTNHDAVVEYAVNPVAEKLRVTLIQNDLINVFS